MPNGLFNLCLACTLVLTIMYVLVIASAKYYMKKIDREKKELLKWQRELETQASKIRDCKNRFHLV